MRRREFIAVSRCGGCAAARVPGAAMRPGAGASATCQRLERAGRRDRRCVSVQALRELGYVEGQQSHDRVPLGRRASERLPALAADLVAPKVDLIVTAGRARRRSPPRSATTTIPIVLAQQPDPVGDGLVASLARPGGNVTGRSLYAPEITPKRARAAQGDGAGSFPCGALCGTCDEPRQAAPSTGKRSLRRGRSGCGSPVARHSHPGGSRSGALRRRARRRGRSRSS